MRYVFKLVWIFGIFASFPASFFVILCSHQKVDWYWHLFTLLASRLRLRTTYSCHLEIPAREDAMFQVLVEGVGRMYPSIEGANPSIRHELLGPEEAHHDAASGWIISGQFSVFTLW